MEHLSRLPFSLHPLIAEAKRRARQRRVLVAVGVLLLAGLATGLMLALRPTGGGSGGGHPAAFEKISAAQHAQTGATVLPPSILAALEQANADTQSRNAPTSAGVHGQFALLLLDTARFLGKVPGGAVYALTNTHGEFCAVDAIDAPHGGPPGFSEECSPPLSRSQPITIDASRGGSPGAGYTFHVAGVAMNGVTSVSFTVSGKAVTVPVKNNVFGLNRHSSAASAQCPVAHFADGSILNVPVYLCRSGRHVGGTSQSG